MYSGGLADGIWGEAPDAYVPGSILAYWKLCIAAGLQMEYGMRPGCICARVDTRELGAMYSGGLADGIWECQDLVLYSKPGSLRIFWPRGRKKKKGFRNGQFHIPSHFLFFFIFHLQVRHYKGFSASDRDASLGSQSLRRARAEARRYSLGKLLRHMQTCPWG